MLVKVAIGISIFSVVAGLAAVILWVPERMVAWVGAAHDPQYATLVDKYRATLTQAIGGMLVLGGLFFTAKNFFASERGQTTKTLAEAIAQLGTGNPDEQKSVPVRLGAIYSLERLSRSSFEDTRIIRKILIRYVEAESLKTRSAFQTGSKPSSSSDVESALIVLGLLNQADSGDKDRVTITDSFLPGLTLNAQRLANFCFIRAVLSGSQLDGADCRSARFEGGELIECNLARSLFVGSTLYRVNVTGSILHKADLTGAHFVDCDLSDIDFTEAKLSNAQFSHCDLRGSLFTGACLVSAVVQDCCIPGAVFENADLSRADFRSAKGYLEGQFDAAAVKPELHMWPSPNRFDPPVAGHEIEAVASEYYRRRGGTPGTAEEDWLLAEADLKRKRCLP